MSNSNRRDFLKKTGEAAALTAAVAWSKTSRAADANSRPVVAVIGPGGMGTAHVQMLAGNKDVDLAYVCDVDQLRLDKAAREAEKISGRAPKAVKDLRQVLDDQSVDAVWIATPDHWHGPATILACQAGKHVYVEKPCAHNIREGRLMIEAARKHNRVVQVGTQSRSTAHTMKAMNLLREGVIGEVLVAKAWNSQRRGSIGHVKPSQPPSNLDYDLWLGPAPETPYRTNVVHNNWRWWRAFGGGDMGNDGIHDIDIARWGLGVETHPTRVASLGGKYYFDDDQEFPDTQYVVCEYEPAEKGGRTRQLIFEQRIWSPYVQEGHENGNAFYGTRGVLIFGKKEGYALYGPRNKLIEKVSAPGPDLAAHHRNFLECIQTGQKPHADIEVNHASSSICHLGNLAARFGRVLHFDPQKEQIEGDAEANALVRRSYRTGHWAAPQNA